MLFQFNDIDWLYVLLVTIITFPFGALWHSRMLFGKQWMEDNNLTKEKARSANPLRLFGVTAVFHFVLFAALDAAIGSNSNWITGMLTGLYVGLFFILTTFGGTYLFASRTNRLLLIDAGYYIFILALGGLILGALK